MAAQLIGWLSDGRQRLQHCNARKLRNMATPQVKDLVLRSPAGSSEVITFAWPLQVGSGQDKHDNGIDIIDTIKFVCEELPSISSAFEEINLNQIDTACYKTMTNLVDRFNKAVDSIVALVSSANIYISIHSL